MALRAHAFKHDPHRLHVGKHRAFGSVAARQFAVGGHVGDGEAHKFPRHVEDTEEIVLLGQSDALRHGRHGFGVRHELLGYEIVLEQNSLHVFLDAAGDVVRVAEGVDTLEIRSYTIEALSDGVVHWLGLFRY